MELLGQRYRRCLQERVEVITAARSTVRRYVVKELRSQQTLQDRHVRFRWPDLPAPAYMLPMSGKVLPEGVDGEAGVRRLLQCGADSWEVRRTPPRLQQLAILSAAGHIILNHPGGS